MTKPDQQESAPGLLLNYHKTGAVFLAELLTWKNGRLRCRWPSLPP